MKDWELLKEPEVIRLRNRINFLKHVCMSLGLANFVLFVVLETHKIGGGVHYLNLAAMTVFFFGFIGYRECERVLKNRE